MSMTYYFKSILMLSVLLPAASQALDVMDDASMGTVVGGDGIALGLEYGVNTDQNGDPLAALGAGCTNTTSCRFAYKIAARESGGGTWTVFKESYMSLKIPALNIGVLPAMSAVGSNTAYYDASRFMNGTTCLLPSGDCSTVVTSGIGTLPAMMLFYPVSTPTYTPGTTAATSTSAGYTSLGLGMTIGRMALEFGATGYNADANGSFLGAKIADNNGNFAGMAIAGKAYVYGF